jgi:hypothetical protein
MDEKIIENQNTQQLPLVRLELAVDVLIELLSDFKTFVIQKVEPRNKAQLYRAYNNVLLRSTQIIRDGRDWNISYDMKYPLVVETIEGYIRLLHDKKIYNIGLDEVVFWKIGSQ